MCNCRKSVARPAAQAKQQSVPAGNQPQGRPLPGSRDRWSGPKKKA